jgi:thiosulfate/3-mercaptopyruvate sulfurtransferase
LKGAIQVPMAKAFGADGRLLPDAELLNWLSECGVRSDVPVLVYDQGDGQAGAMIAWILEYLGHPDVCFMREAFEHWRESGGELFYRPVEPSAGSLESLVTRSSLRVAWQEVLHADDVNLIDARSHEEFTGVTTIADDPPGRIPGAKSLPWLEVVDGKRNLWVSPERVAGILEQAGMAPGRHSVAYCRVGTRAAVVVLALLAAGYPVSLYDGSWIDWCSHPDLPLEASAETPVR